MQAIDSRRDLRVELLWSLPPAATPPPITEELMKRMMAAAARNGMELVKST
jgi:hypothetical protein